MAVVRQPVVVRVLAVCSDFPEALQEGDSSAVRLAHRELSSGSPLQGRKDGMDEDAQHLAAELLVEGEAVAEGEGKREHVLAYRSLGQDAVDQVRRGVGNAAGSARWAKGPRLAGKGHQSLTAALLAPNAEKAVGEDSTGEEGAELLLDEAGYHAALIAGRGEKGLEVMLKDAVEDGGLGRAPLVLRRVGLSVADGNVTRHEKKPLRVACPRRPLPCAREKVAAARRVILRSHADRDEAFTG
jgi:hypothetical protein